MLEAFGVVGVERVVGRESSDESVQQLVFAECLSLGGVVDGEEWVVLEQASLDGAQSLLLLVFIIRVVDVALRRKYGISVNSAG